MMAESTIYFSRAIRAEVDDVLVRTPELRVLRERTVAVFGAGCLGAPSILELARAGVGEVRILDHDIVDPGTIGRWPFGLNAAGRPKVNVLAEFITANYPSTRIVPRVHCIGAVRDGYGHGDVASDAEALDEMTTGASLIYDATAEIGVQHYLSEAARALNIPYVGLGGTFGGSGGLVACILPGRTDGCWMCYQHALADQSIPEPPFDPGGEVQPLGCGDVTFTGAGFDMAQIALAAVRMAVSVLCDGVDGGYPPAGFDVMTVAFRDRSGRLIAPEFRPHKLHKHPNCRQCGNQ